jgi:hypothetical protein
MKKIDFLLTMVIVSIALFFVGKTTYNKLEEKQYIIEELQQTNEQHINMIDSLIVTSTLLEKYYCATENLLDSIFKHYVWQDVMDPYEYYEAVDNIYYQEFLYRHLENKRKQIYE